MRVLNVKRLKQAGFRYRVHGKGPRRDGLIVSSDGYFDVLVDAHGAITNWNYVADTAITSP